MKKIISLLIALIISFSVLVIPLSSFADTAHVYDANSIVALAKKQYGKPYQKGTQGSKSFDCIGLVCYVYKQNNVKIPFTTSTFNKKQLSKVGVLIERKDLQPGDVVCYGSAEKITHVGIYIGSGIMINAMNAKSGVKYCFIDQKAYNADSAKNTSSGKTVKIDGKTYTLGYFNKSLCYGVRIYGSDITASVQNPASCVYTGSAVKPAVRVAFGSATLKEGTDYTVSYANNTKVGTAIARVTGKGHYKGVSTEVEFKIIGEASHTLELNQAILPSGALAKGRSFTISGLITADSPITWVDIEVYDRNGKVVCASDARPDCGQLSIYYMDHELSFAKLNEGEYAYRLRAVTENAEKTWTGSFRIVKSDVKGSKMTYPSGTLQKGKTFSIKGTISSAAKINKVTLSVYTIDGEKRFEASANPNAKSFDVHTLDAKMKFAKLSAGTYIYRVAVTDRNGTVSYVITHSFTVR